MKKLILPMLLGMITLLAGCAGSAGETSTDAPVPSPLPTVTVTVEPAQNEPVPEMPPEPTERVPYIEIFNNPQSVSVKNFLNQYGGALCAPPY